MRILAPLAALTIATAAHAAPVNFADGWREQRLSLFSSNDYSFGESLQMVSDGSVSIAWSRVDRSDWDKRRASWVWQVDQGVPPTDLGQKGGDDRNISIYFVFLPQDQAEALANANIRRLMGNDQVRILQYAWGGNHSVGEVIMSPYGPPGQGATIALRPASTGVFREAVDLSADYARAFGGSPDALVGLAVSGDSDDTESFIRAAIAELVLE